ncbi:MULTISPECIES: hypothetical protein [unclassified Streptomyces]|uniref:hypothetical protein n=1 Tax=unclassified Streptomyces TaxID=2593676 RepID=UPI000823AE8F|nr:MULTISPECIES: hypothetical protein [unclassified Streptomyces]MYT99968.1 hypothetical protein [Streptomyces sp. SID8350]SCK52404.1 hypothetical protein YUWDRAFT_04643 [Streptomyces sp. AmelKG-D3]
MQQGRYRLTAAPPAFEVQQEVGIEDPGTIDRVVARDLEPVDSGFAPASFGHRLIENRLIIDPAEWGQPGAVNGWSRADEPDRWRTICYPSSETVN